MFGVACIRQVLQYNPVSRYREQDCRLQHGVLQIFQMLQMNIKQKNSTSLLAMEPGDSVWQLPITGGQEKELAMVTIPTATILKVHWDTLLEKSFHCR